MTSDIAEVRRREATRAAVKYFLLAFLTFLALSGVVAYAVITAADQARESHSIRMGYCQELEKLKTQNREEVALAKRQYRRNLRLLGIKDTPELRRAVEEGWARTLRRNRPRSCPYTA